MTISKAIKDCGSSSDLTSNQGIIYLRSELAKRPNAEGLIRAWFGESDLSFAVSKVINEVHKIFTNPKGMDLKDSFHTYTKITALLMMYNYCKDNAKDTLDSNFNAIVHNSIDSKKSDTSVQINKGQIEEFIHKLVSSSTYNRDTQEYTISMKDYAIHDGLFLAPEKEANASFVVKMSSQGASLFVPEQHGTETPPLVEDSATTYAEEDDDTTSALPEHNATIAEEATEALIDLTTLGNDIYSADLD